MASTTVAANAGLESALRQWHKNGGQLYCPPLVKPLLALPSVGDGGIGTVWVFDDLHVSDEDGIGAVSFNVSFWADA